MNSCQMVRSDCNWSLGLDETMTEKSIQRAYLTLIGNANNFIYIENQFFCSSPAGEPVINHICEALIEKLITKICNKEKFKVIVLMPLLPGFEGNINDASGNCIRIV